MNADKTVKVGFEPIPYLFNLSVVGEHGTVSSSPAGPMIGYNTQVTLTAVPNPGYRVKAWTGARYTPATGNNTNEVTIQGDTTVTVEFEPSATAMHNLTASVKNGNGSVTPASGTYEENAEVTLTANPNTGFQVKAWTGTNDDTSKSNTNTVTMTADKTVTVEFEQTFKLSASVTGGHGTVTPTAGTYVAGQTVTLTATPETGYRVKAWTGTNTAPAAGHNDNTVTMSADKTITVEFEPNPEVTRALTVNVIGGHGTVSPASGIYSDQTTVTLTATPDANYRVKAWTGTANDTSTSNTNSVVMSADKTVTVEFEIITYTLTTAAYSPEQGTVTPTKGTYEINTVVTVTATPKSADYRVKSWYGTDSVSDDKTTGTVKMTANKSVSVFFEPIPYTLTKTVEGGHGTLISTPAGPTINAGTVVSLTATPDPGYRVKEWTGAESVPSIGSTTNYVKMSSDRSVSVTFEPLPAERCSLTATVIGGHGAVFPASGTYEKGSSVMLTAIPDSTYKVKWWNSNPNLVGDSFTSPINSDMNVTVQFEKIIQQFQLTTSVVNNTGGTISPASGPFDEGSKVTLTATPDSGYRVKKWENTDIVPATGNNNNTVTMSAEKNVTVEFEPIPAQTFCSLLVNIVGQGTVSPVSGKYLSNSTVTLVATPSSGYHIKSWSGTDNDLSTSVSNTVTITGDKTVTLTFEKDTPLTYLLTVNIPTGHGTITPAGGVCLANSNLRLVAVPESGYRVKSWSGTANDPAAGSNTNQVFMSSDKTVTVEFEEISPSPMPQPQQSSQDPNALVKEVAAVQQMVTTASPLCGAGALTVLPLCLAFGFLLKLNYMNRNR